MQNLTQMLMQQWGRADVRQVFNINSLPLTSSAILAMLLVGCSFDDDSPDDTDTQVAISRLINSNIDANALQNGLDAAGKMLEVHSNPHYANEIKSKADFVAQVEANDSGTFYFQYEDEYEEIKYATLEWSKVTVNFKEEEGIYYFEYNANILGLGGSYKSVIHIDNLNQFRVYEVAYDPDQMLFKAQGSDYKVCSDEFDEKLYLMTWDQCPVSLSEVGRDEVNFLDALEFASNQGYVFDWPKEDFMAESFNDAQSKQVGDVTIHSPDSPPSCDYMYNIESLNKMVFDHHGETVYAVRAYGHDYGVAVVKGVEEDGVIKYQDIGLQSQGDLWSCIVDIA